MNDRFVGVFAIGFGLLGHVILMVGSLVFNMIGNDLNHSYYQAMLEINPIIGFVSLLLWILVIYGFVLIIIDLFKFAKKRDR